MMADDKCPCGNEAGYDACCGQLHRNERTATTALELMKSRYSAYCRGLAEYLVATHSSSQPEDQRRRALVESFTRTQWLGLRIIDTVAGKSGDNDGIVEFEAKHVTDGKPAVHRERSRFCRKNGAWVYLDAINRDQMKASKAR